MLNALKNIYNIIKQAFQFLSEMIQNLFAFVGAIPKYISYLTQIIGVLPSLLITFATVSIMIYLMLTLVNRR